jgi:hypothetical protein
MRVLIMSDKHCGHKSGLTHPDFDSRPNNIESTNYKYWRIRNKEWNWFSDMMEKLKPIDVAIVNADNIDGRGDKSGGTELLLRDRNEQVDCAIACIEEIGAKDILMTYGTPYHTGSMEDWEDQIAKGVNAVKIESHGHAELNGLVFDYRHHVGRSSVPYGKFTAIAKEKLWNQLWAERGEYPSADVIVRSHAHYLAFCGGPGWLAVTTPGLQGYWSKYGSRRVSGDVDFGLVWFDIKDRKEWSWDYRVKRLRSKRDVIKIRTEN